MRILLAHNAYQQRGGEDEVVDSEIALLRRHGHEVIEYRRHNDELVHLAAAGVALDTLWSRRTTRDVRGLIARHRPEVLHAHNTFPLISPALYWAAAEARVPVVQTVHNYRLVCPQGSLLREGRVCEDCVGRTPWPALRHGCYRGSRAQTALLAGHLVLHRALGSWQHKVACWIALSQFARNKLVAAGLPPQRIAVEGNFVDAAPALSGERQGLLFVGRLAPEKGVQVLARAMALCPGLTLDVIGAGPESAYLQGLPGVRLLGALTQAQVAQAMQRAGALVLPSICHEMFPRTLVEAYAAGLPVIGSRLGALAELVHEGRTGLGFAVGDAAALAERLRWAAEHAPEMQRMGQGARQEYEAHYSGERHHAALMAIYRRVMASGG